MLYLDTSILIAALVPEASSDRIASWLIPAEAGTLHISGWTLAEVSSALALKVRIKALSLEERADALARFVQLVEQSFTLVKVADSHFETAARFCDNAELNLRAGDALHLAIASTQGMTLATLDRSMAEAGLHLGIATQIP